MSKFATATARVIKGAARVRATKAALMLTPEAIYRVKELLQREPGALALKIGVRQRGRNGLTYPLDYAKERGRFDEEVEQDGAKLWIDTKAQLSLLGTEMEPSWANYAREKSERARSMTPGYHRTKYTADPNAPVNVALAPNIDAVDPHLLVGDTVSNMKTGKAKGSKEDGWMSLSYRSTEGFKGDHRATARRAEQKQDNTFCTNYTRRSRSASAPRSSAPPEQRNVWRNNQEKYDPNYHGADKMVIDFNDLSQHA